jgi:hypothetical protein
MTHRLRRDLGRALNWCWHVEPNPKGTGQHIHGWQWGDFIPQRALSAAAGSVGMGRVVYVNRVKAKPGQSLDYGMKLAGVAYGLKLAQAEATMKVYREANGNRLVHASRGFWRGEDGKPYAGQREAMSAWASRNRSASDDQAEWVLVREEQLAEARSGPHHGQKLALHRAGKTSPVTRLSTRNPAFLGHRPSLLVGSWPVTDSRYRASEEGPAPPSLSSPSIRST